MVQFISEIVKLKRLYEELLSKLTGTYSLPRRPAGLYKDPPYPPSVYVH
jgi:hypothetical protein